MHDQTLGSTVLVQRFLTYESDNTRLLRGRANRAKRLQQKHEGAKKTRKYFTLS